MLKGHNIICISTIDWDFIWQQHQTIMSTFAKNNNRVLFIENTGVRAPQIKDIGRLRKRILNWFRSTKGFRKEMDNLYVFSPLILPFPYMRLARWINRVLLIRALKRWMKAADFYDPIIWTFLPTPIVLDLVDAIPHKAFVYYCGDNLAATSKAARKVTKYEKKVLSRADAVFVMAKSMFEYCKSRNKNVTCVPMGVDTDSFTDSAHIDEWPSEIKNVKNRIVGFVGGVRNSIDQNLVGFLSKKFSDFTFVFVGPIQTDVSNMQEKSNIIFVGQKKHKELSGYIKHFDVSIIPYKKDDYTDNISPAKLNEYLIMGKPVVSTNLREVETFNRENGDILYVTDNHRDFADLISKAITEDNDHLKKRRIEIALNNSWTKKVEAMSNIIDEVLTKKEYETGLRWQSRLLGLYNALRKRIIKIAATLVVLYAIIFYSPLIWFLAKPLEISQAPEKADAILVFGGGVGETGSPGKSTIERARFSVELYKKGLAKKIIYSSGYTYKYNDAENMKLFAMSMGIPSKDIILEKKANSAYENVKYSTEILKEKGFDKIILVSSPYNMRRADLVFKHIAKDVGVICTPVPDPQFYRRQRPVKPEQIRALLHEYFGILYYLSKGYI